jgi:2-C-methyl-D-erythritol 4-phosphate cytidylyltransferase
MGFDKLQARLLGRPVLAWSCDAFQNCPEVSEFVLVTRQELVPTMEQLARMEKWTKLKAVIQGGLERHLSVWEGLRSLESSETEFVAIHDGARPLVTPEMIRNCLKLARKHGAACCAAPIPDTVKRAEHDVVTESVNREGLWGMQTPQIFSSALILQAYAAVMSRGELVTDEVSAVQRLGKKVVLMPNEEWNLKITYPRDLMVAEGVLRARRAGATTPEAAAEKPA